MNTKSKLVLNSLMFLIPSILGIVLFLVPFSFDGTTTILFGHAKNYIDGKWHDGILVFGLVIMFATIIISTIGSTVLKEKWSQNKILKSFVQNPVWLSITILGAITYIIVYFQIGLEEIIGEYTGQIVLHDIIPGLIITFIIANIILPLLMDFGLLDFLGALLAKVMRFLFKVPGRSAIDAVSSFVGDGTLGILVTDDQYVKGNYTRREAVLIATGFSVVGIASVAYVASQFGLDTLFLPMYGVVILTTMFIAFVIARLPLIKRYEDTYYSPDGQTKKTLKKEDENISIKQGYINAVESAKETFKNLSEVYLNIISKIIYILFGLIPLIMVIGTFVLVISEHTPLFDYLAYPIIPILYALQIPNAEIIAPAMLAGFGDMFVPLFMFDVAVVETKALFFTGVMVLVQLIFLSETGTVLMKAKFKLSFLEILGFFMLRTAIALPFVAICTHILGAFGLF